MTYLGLNIASTICTIAGQLYKSAYKKGHTPKRSDVVDDVKDPNYKEFESYKEYKADMGKANDSPIKYGDSGEKGTYEWHHLVEQNQIKNKGLEPTQIYNTDNTVSLGYKSHRDVSRIYSSNIKKVSTELPISVMEQMKGSTNMTVRAWMSRQDYATQMKCGKEILKFLGVLLK